MADVDGDVNNMTCFTLEAVSNSLSLCIALVLFVSPRVSK